jgi:hypothetical protein
MEKVAFHEAGHAVVGWSLGVLPARICLDPKTQGGGVEPAVDPSQLCLVQQIALHYGGPVSEKIFKGPAVSRRCLADHVNVHNLLEANGTPEEEPEGQALQKRAYACAEKVLREHKDRVERVCRHWSRRYVVCCPSSKKI